MRRYCRALLALVAALSFAVALSYPLRYRMEEQSAEEGLSRLLEMRDAGLANGTNEGARAPEATVEGGEASASPAPPAQAEAARKARERTDAAAADESAASRGDPGAESAAGGDADGVKEAVVAADATPDAKVPADADATGGDAAAADAKAAADATGGGAATSSPAPTPSPTPVPTPTVNRFERDSALPYDKKVKRTLDESAILPQYREIYAENHDFVGWLTIPGTVVDYPVVQCEDSDYYLKHDFYGNKNANGQIILDTKCDPYTPSYNLVISGHSMRSGKMFGRLVDYMYQSYWKKHKLVYFDTLMEQKEYVVLAAFFSADYDVDEEGFRYNADIRYSLDARQWLREVRANRLYDTGIDAEFGDEFLTLTTCNKAHRSDGRFVVICRRLREGETIS